VEGKGSDVVSDGRNGAAGATSRRGRRDVTAASDGKRQHGGRQLATVPAGTGSRPTAATSRRRRHD